MGHSSTPVACKYWRDTIKQHVVTRLMFNLVLLYFCKNLKLPLNNIIIISLRVALKTNLKRANMPFNRFSLFVVLGGGLMLESPQSAR